MTQVSIIIPAHNEANYIGACLKALLASEPVGSATLQIVVIANACVDATASITRGLIGDARQSGWNLTVLETATPGKLNALNLAEASLVDDIRIYLDADVRVSAGLIGQLVSALDHGDAGYASGSPQVVAPPSRLLRAYARFWTSLPFVANGVPGFGIFAVNSAGRQRWSAFPNIISDDTFVRLQFSPSERIGVPAPYRWPMVEGFGNLVRVRRRQDRGVAEITRRFPKLSPNATGSRPNAVGLARLMLRDPGGFLAYALVSLVVRLPILQSSERWTRGR